MALDLRLTESEEMLKKTALDFLRRDAPKEVVQTLQDTDTGHNDELWQKAVEMGWLGIIIPEQYGGTENPLTSAAVLFEVLGSAPLPGPYFSSAILGSSILLEAGSRTQKEAVLPQVVEGKNILSLALTEPAYSWEPAAIQTRATDKKDHFILNGIKLFTLEAGAATHFIVAARTGSEAGGQEGISLFLVDAQSEGISVRSLPGFMSGQTFEVKLDSVKVAESALLGEPGGGWPALQRAIDRSIPVLCAYKVGACQALFEMSLEYSRIRVQFGQPIGRFQRVQDLIIEMIDHLDAARWATYECLWKLDTGRPAAESIHLAKAISSQAYWDVTTLALRVFSGISYSREHPVSFHTRESRRLYSYLGEPTYHRQKLARFILE